MLSKALNASLISSFQAGKRWCPIYVSQRSSSYFANHPERSQEQRLQDWEKAKDAFYSPERDTKNFPHPKMPETNPPTRLGLLPESWFTALYPKLGVTGGYTLLGGFTMYLLSKEYLVYEHNLAEFVAFWMALYGIRYKFGDKIKEYFIKTAQEDEAASWDIPLDAAKKKAKWAVEQTESAIASEQGQPLLWNAKKENVGLQLEANYRQRLTAVHDQVKRQLDYYVAMEQAKRSFQQRHMVDWIVNSVRSSITPQQEKESIVKCISDLKTLAASHVKA